MKFRHYDKRYKEFRYSDKNPEEFYFTEKGIEYRYTIPMSEAGLEKKDYHSLDVDIFTGLKDKNNNEIYQNDIINAFNSSLEVHETNIVSFLNGTFTIGRYWKDGQHDWCSMENYDSFELEIIDNKYENTSIDL